MSATVTIRDETTLKKTIQEFELEIPSERVSLRELIRCRVYQEVKDYNAKQSLHKPVEFTGLVQPTEVELALNGSPSERNSSTIDWNRQFDRALAAVRANQILVLVNDRQVEGLDEILTLNSDSKVSFLRLTMLTGG